MVRIIDIPVSVQGSPETWSLDVSRYVSEPTRNLRYRLTLRGGGEDTWTADEWEVFEGLFSLRRQVEPLGVFLCCNGCRRNAWASGMDRDMGRGWTLYLLREGLQASLDDRAGTFDAAPCDEVVSLADQIDWYGAWWKSATS